MSNKINFEGTLDRIEENQAVILLGTGEQINIPTEYLPFDADEGSLVKLTIKVLNQASLASEIESKETTNELEDADYQEEMFYEE